MLVLDKKILTFKVKEVHFSDHPYDVEECDAICFPLCRNKVTVDGFDRKESLTSIIDLTQHLDTIWYNMDKKSSRYAIKKAQRDGVEFKVNQNYDEFYHINETFVKQKGFGPLLGIRSINLDVIKRYGTLFTSEYKGDVLSGHLYLEDEDNIKLWLSASKRLEVDRERARLIGNANRLLHWEAIKYAKGRGIRVFDWGGLWPEEEANNDARKKTINFFKQSFGGTTVICYNYRKIYSPIYKLGSNMLEKANCMRRLNG